jgi:protein SCO1/2
MSNTKLFHGRSVVCALAALALSLGACARPHAPAPKPPEEVDAEVLSAREWMNESGARVAIMDYRGTPFVITGVETSCTSACPTTMEKVRGVDKTLRAHGVAANVILVSLDPKHDTPEELARFKQARHLPQHWHLLAGNDAETHAFAKYLDMSDVKARSDGEHDVRIALFDAGGRQTHTFHGWEFDADEAIDAPR